MEQLKVEVLDAKQISVSKIVELLCKYDEEMLGYIETTEEDIMGLLDSVGRGDAWCLTLDNSEIVGFMVVTGNGPVFPSLLVIHPNFKEKCFETLLFEKLNTTMQIKCNSLRQNCTVTVLANNVYEEKLFGNQLFYPVRYWWEMGITLETNKPLYALQGFSIRNVEVGLDDQELYEAFEEVFQDHFDYRPSSFEDFKARYDRPSFDPKLWYVLLDGLNIVGFIFMKNLAVPGKAEITHLGIRRKWRGRGLAKNLLTFAFNVLVDMGRNDIVLSVDSDSLTQATKVYKSVGMKEMRSFVRYDKTFKFFKS